MSVKNYLTGLAIGASALAYSADAQAGIPPTNEQQAKIDRAMEEIYRNKPKYEPTSQSEAKSKESLGIDPIGWGGTVLLFFLIRKPFSDGGKNEQK